MRIRWLPAIVMAALACATAKHPEVPAQRALTSKEKHCWIPGRSGMLSGRVIDDSTGNSLPGVRLDVSPGGTKAVTDSAGRYRVGPLCPGHYAITVESDAFYQWSRPRIYVASDSQHVRDVHVAPLLCTDITPLGQVSGVVVGDSTGHPIEGAQITVADSNCGAITDTLGRFFIRAVPSGTQRLVARRIGYSFVARTLTIPPGKVTPVWFEMRPAPTHMWVTPVPADSAPSP